MDLDRHVLERLIRIHERGVYRYLRYLGADVTVAEDLVQETFLAAWRGSPHQPDVADDPSWGGWLRGIARNLFLAECRRRAGSAVLATDLSLTELEAAESQTLWDQTEWAERRAALRTCLETLPAPQRQALEQRYTTRVARKDMARLLDLSEDGVKSLLRRIRAALAVCIESRLAMGDGKQSDGPI